MSKKTVRVEIPSGSPDEMLDLGDGITSFHEKLGDKSPLNNLPMNILKDKLAAARPKRKKALDLYAEAKPLMDEANTLIGIAEGQTSETPDTLYNIMIRVRGALLSAYKGNEEKLSEAGFNVVIGSFAPTGRRKKDNPPA